MHKIAENLCQIQPNKSDFSNKHQKLNSGSRFFLCGDLFTPGRWKMQILCAARNLNGGALSG